MRRQAYAYDVVVVGAGPNGLAAAVALAREGLSVRVIEALDQPGGGTRSDALTLPGFQHDICSAVHPLGIASPFFRSLQLERYGLRWRHPPAALAHVFQDGHAVTLERSIARTAEQLGRDGSTYRTLMQPFVDNFDAFLPMVLGPLHIPRKPFLLAHFGLLGIHSMTGLAKTLFREDTAAALLGGIASHAMLPLDAPLSSAFGLVLAIAAHAVGWPIPERGSQAIADALVACLRAHGGELELGRRVTNLKELPRARAYLLDLTPRQVLDVAGGQLNRWYCKRLEHYRYGPGVYKMDFALHEPIPWRDPACARAATVHLSGGLAQLARNEARVHEGGVTSAPFVLVVQPSLFDETRAPQGKHTAWAYCHVPNGSAIDASARIEAQIERFAPGFRSRIAARARRSALEVELENPNYVGGDINGGISDATQLFTRPVTRIDPYTTPAKHIFLCSSATPPGGGVHGMCGYWAARSVLAHVFGRRHAPPLAMTG